MEVRSRQDGRKVKEGWEKGQGRMGVRSRRDGRKVKAGWEKGERGMGERSRQDRSKVKAGLLISTVDQPGPSRLVLSCYYFPCASTATFPGNSLVLC